MANNSYHAMKFPMYYGVWTSLFEDHRSCLSISNFPRICFYYTSLSSIYHFVRERVASKKLFVLCVFLWEVCWYTQQRTQFSSFQYSLLQPHAFFLSKYLFLLLSKTSFLLYYVEAFCTMVNIKLPQEKISSLLTWHMSSCHKTSELKTWGGKGLGRLVPWFSSFREEDWSVTKRRKKTNKQT